MKWTTADKSKVGERIKDMVSAAAAAEDSFSKLGGRSDSEDEYHLLNQLEHAQDAASAAVVDLDIAITEHEKGAPS